MPRWVTAGFTATVLFVAPSCGISTAQPRTRTERVEQTRIALSAVLTEKGAAEEARRLVEVCDRSPEEMFSQSFVVDPDGPEMFDTIAELEATPRTSGTAIGIAVLACTSGDFEVMTSLGDI